DALYPGDEHGYVAKFLKFVTARNARVWSFYVLCDFRQAESQGAFAISSPKDEHDSRSTAVTVISPLLPGNVRCPRIAEPRADVRILGGPWRYGGMRAVAAASARVEFSGGSARLYYSQHEFSTEFWHNASVLRLF